MFGFFRNSFYRILEGYDLYSAATIDPVAKWFSSSKGPQEGAVPPHWLRLESYSSTVCAREWVLWCACCIARSQARVDCGEERVLIRHEGVVNNTDNTYCERKQQRNTHTPKATHFRWVELELIDFRPWYGWIYFWLDWNSECALHNPNNECKRNVREHAALKWDCVCRFATHFAAHTHTTQRNVNKYLRREFVEPRTIWMLFVFSSKIGFRSVLRIGYFVFNKFCIFAKIF